MARPKTTLSKTELARELNLSKGRISQLIAKGLPVREDGRVDRAEAVRWYEKNIVPRPKDETVAPHLVHEVARPTAGAAPLRADAATVAAAQREILDRIHERMACLPRLFLQLGAPMRVVNAVADCADSLFWAAVGEEKIEELYGDAGPKPVPKPDCVALAKEAGIAEIDPEAWERGGDQIVEEVDAFLG